ncbi:hypothetical protein BaRGS_00020238, partial [Batillaria attramentaria]
PPDAVSPANGVASGTRTDWGKSTLPSTPCRIKGTALAAIEKSYCVNDDNLASVCSAITGDFPLHTIVKVTGQPIPCPFQGPYFFSYTNGSVEEWCRDPSSEIKACADKSRFIFNYKRCKELSYTRDTELTFQCLATWFNGLEQYLYGKFTATGRPDRNRMYRCFMISLYGTRGDMSMSQDATCQGLSHPTFGMNTFSLQYRKEEWPQPECVFPSWLGRGQAWRDVGGKWRMTVDSDGEELSLHDLLHPDFLVPGELTPATLLRVRCLELTTFADSKTAAHNTLPEVHVLTFATNDSCTPSPIPPFSVVCSYRQAPHRRIDFRSTAGSGDMCICADGYTSRQSVSTHRCVRLKQRAERVFEMRIGAATDDTYLACQDTFFTNSRTHVFFPHEEEGVQCPRMGSYTYRERKGDCTGSLDIGCEHQSQMLLHATCSREQTAEILQCYQTWIESSQMYVIISRPGDTYSPAYCLTSSDVVLLKAFGFFSLTPKQVFKQTTTGYTLQEAADCGSGGIHIMNRPVDYIVNSPKKTCERRKLPAPYHPVRQGETDDTKIERSDLTSTSRPQGTKPGHSSQSPTDLTKVKLINNSNTRTCAIDMIFLCTLLTVVLNERSGSLGFAGRNTPCSHDIKPRQISHGKSQEKEDTVRLAASDEKALLIHYNILMSRSTARPISGLMATKADFQLDSTFHLDPHLAAWVQLERL